MSLCDLKFLGKPCKRGHEGVRYRSTGNCVACLKERQPKKEGKRTGEVGKLRAAAADAGERTFQGAPCKRGHSGLRWVSTGGCVECTRAAADKVRLATSSQMPTAKVHVARELVRRFGREVLIYAYIPQTNSGPLGLKKLCTSWDHPIARKYWKPCEKVYSGPLVTREEARKSGSPRYFTGKPCANGHVAPRYTKSGACTECLLEASRNNISKLGRLKLILQDRNVDTIAMAAWLLNAASNDDVTEVGMLQGTPAQIYVYREFLKRHYYAEVWLDTCDLKPGPFDRPVLPG